MLCRCSLNERWRANIPSAKSFFCVISFSATIAPCGRCHCYSVLQMGRPRLSITRLGRGGAWTATQICLTMVLATHTGPLSSPQVPCLRPLLQPGGVGQQAPGPCGHCPGGCTDEAGGGGLGHIWGTLLLLPMAPGAPRRRQSGSCHFLQQPSQGPALQAFGEGGTDHRLGGMEQEEARGSTEP